MLHDRLLDLFTSDPSLQLGDVLVLLPELDAAAPLIDAVFGSAPAPLALPYSLSGQSRPPLPPLRSLRTAFSRPHRQANSQRPCGRRSWPRRAWRVRPRPPCPWFRRGFFGFSSAPLCNRSSKALRTRSGPATRLRQTRVQLPRCLIDGARD
ncbi:MAG TPA: exodeoxyribonuclease V subunit gamma [bacterium]|nr:exodeoxyribonuclease V subunit gamma [bacterium]